MVKRIHIIAGVVIVGGLTMGGCATGGLPAKDAPKISQSSGGTLSGEIKVWSWDVAAKALQRMAPEFEKTHPGVKVQVVDIGYDNAYDKITVGLKSGSGLPDVITLEDDRISGYVENFPNGLVDLSGVASKYKADFDQAKWAAATSGKGLFALPWDSAPVGLFYRRDYFKQAGVDPDSIVTWDDAIKAGEKIKQVTGKRLFVADLTTPDMFTTLLQQLGQGYFKDGKVAVNSPAAVRALTLLKTLKDKDLLQNEKGWDGRVTATKQGKTATQPTAAWWSGTLTGEMPELSGKFGVVPLPAFDANGVRTSANGGSALAVTSQTKNQEAAWAFVQWLLASKDNQVAMMRNEALFPAYLPALTDPLFDEAQPYFGGQRVNRLFADEVRNIPPIELTGDDSQAREILKKAVSGSLLDGDDPKAALDEAATRIASATKRPLAQ
ncbi:MULTISPECIES: ABC transporter substrate-binding protein [Streptosporangium]|uniref:Lactose/L-arabinose transport system substrate-binding protein n=1 Tax=Streptosporangium brasiliense TaxID=47480 RepID=A0ABT9RER1_9ACTN|nr:sugar ABC transporter substrate-binding protein [Streptosporangium brasiliense]MDP9866875.1 lactose/L-arabinose transport system substrate-binding protein [Streptosporangium brasiliense]